LASIAVFFEVYLLRPTEKADLFWTGTTQNPPVVAVRKYAKRVFKCSTGVLPWTRRVLEKTPGYHVAHSVCEGFIITVVFEAEELATAVRP